MAVTGDDIPRLHLYEDDAEAVDELFRQSLLTEPDKAFTDFMAFLARFPRRSLFNALLIRVQRPGAVAVASRNKWWEFGRTVNADAVPIVILHPFGPVEFVYEVNDTEGSEYARENGWGPFAAKGSLPAGAWDKAVAGAFTFRIVVELVKNYGAALAGTAAVIHASEAGSLLAPGDGKAKFRIRINEALAVPGRFATLAHELGHIYCGHQGGDDKGRWPDRRRLLSLGQRELEAEAVSWLVCRRLGLETRSADYLSHYVADGDLQEISTFAITSAAHRIEAWRSTRGAATKAKAPGHRQQLPAGRATTTKGMRYSSRNGE
jgi:hypothetical protein